MDIFLLLWAILVVILIPLAAGALFALVLREIYVRYPLPLVDPELFIRKPAKRQAELADASEEQETPDESVVSDMTENEEHTESSETESVDEEKTPPPDGASVFDGSENIPNDLPVNETLDSMIAAHSTIVPDDLEHRIEESARLKEELPHEIYDEMDRDDLNDLVAALPKTTVDFADESEMDAETSEAISPMAKELLGENFDFDGLEKEAKQAKEAKETTEAKETKQPFRFLVPDNGTDEAEAADATDSVDSVDSVDSAEVALDIQEDEAGTVQVLSPFLAADSPQFADFTTPQTILPTFSGDWVQETGGAVEPVEGETSNFCFTEESQPMFIRKKRAN